MLLPINRLRLLASKAVGEKLHAYAARRLATQSTGAATAVRPLPILIDQIRPARPMDYGISLIHPY